MNDGCFGPAIAADGSFWLTLLVTILWTVLNVAAHVGIGLALGVLATLADEEEAS